jgi:hypothetical protein
MARKAEWIALNAARERTNDLLGWYPDHATLIEDHIKAGRVPARGVADWDGQLRPVDPGQVERIEFEFRRIYLRRDGRDRLLGRFRILTQAALDWSALEPLVQPEIVTASRRTRYDRAKPPLLEAELRDFLVKLREEASRIPPQEDCEAAVRAHFPDHRVTRKVVRKAHIDVFGRQRPGGRR